jgi:hypothetical protein
LNGIPTDIPDIPNIPTLPTVAPISFDIPNPSVCISFLDIGCWGVNIPPVNLPISNINYAIGNFNTPVGNANTLIGNVNTTLENGYDQLRSGLNSLDNLEIPLPQLQMPTSIGPVTCPNPNPWDNFDINFERLNPLDYNILDPLSNDNEFITFVDSYDNRLGAIRAESIGQFNLRYFKLAKCLEIGSYVLGLFSVDGSVGKNILKLVGEAISYYKASDKIGVEYLSGHGDYAEWLEREDHAENLDYGDIVGVRGGKVSRNLDHAEQIMVVSKSPIVLGNFPDPANEINGNNIAFIGQVPVKVMGPVQTGDYIIANTEMQGYGIAVSDKEITPAQMALAVGRSWEQNLSPGFKFVNTIVGMHNNGWVLPMTKLQQRIDDNENAIQVLTARLDNMENKSSVAEVNKKPRL